MNKETNMISKEQLIENLHKGICTIVFEKVDGTMRTMKCTLHQDYIPERSRPAENLEESTPRKRPEGVIAVWDIENNGWRSFRINQVEKLLESRVLYG